PAGGADRPDPTGSRRPPTRVKRSAARRLVRTGSMASAENACRRRRLPRNFRGYLPGLAKVLPAANLPRMLAFRLWTARLAAPRRRHSIIPTTIAMTKTADCQRPYARLATAGPGQ